MARGLHEAQASDAEVAAQQRRNEEAAGAAAAAILEVRGARSYVFLEIVSEILLATRGCGPCNPIRSEEEEEEETPRRARKAGILST